MRLITDTMRDIKKGRLVEEATAALAEVVRSVDELQKPGSITITLTVKPGDGNEKTIVAMLAIKKPAREIPPAIFFSDADGDLHREDPAQREMEFERVGATSRAPL
jgi:hypothetical protein